MTNGEKIKEIFPNIECEVKDNTVLTNIDNGIWFSLDWWNAKYIESTTKNDCAEQNGCITCSLDDGDDCCRKLFEESMREPTVKNDSAVDCIVDVLGSYTDLDIPYKREISEIILTKLSSITSIRPKGHWKTDRQGDMQCSRCGHQRPYFIDYTSEGCKVRGELTPFCPKCGSDNREVEEC